MALPLSREPERSKLSAREPGGRPAAARPGAVRPPARWGRGGPGAARFGGARAGPAGRAAHFTLEFGLASGRTARRLPQGLARRPHTPRRARPARCRPGLSEPRSSGRRGPSCQTPRPGGPGAAAGALCQPAAPLTFPAPRPVLLLLNDTLGSHSSPSSPPPTARTRTAGLRGQRSALLRPRCERAGSAELTAGSTLFRRDSFKRRWTSNFNSSWAGNGFRLCWSWSVREDGAGWMNWARSVVLKSGYPATWLEN